MVAIVAGLAFLRRTRIDHHHISTFLCTSFLRSCTTLLSGVESAERARKNYTPSRATTLQQVGWRDTDCSKTRVQTNSTRSHFTELPRSCRPASLIVLATRLNFHVDGGPQAMRNSY